MLERRPRTQEQAWDAYEAFGARLRRDPPASDRAGDAMSPRRPMAPLRRRAQRLHERRRRLTSSRSPTSSPTTTRPAEPTGGFPAATAPSLPASAPACPPPSEPASPRSRRAQASGSTPIADRSRRGRQSSPSRPRCWPAARSASILRPTSISTPRRACRSALPTRSSSRSPSRTRSRRRATCSAISTAPAPAATTCGPSAGPVVECFLGGVLARELEAAGENAAVAFVTDELRATCSAPISPAASRRSRSLPGDGSRRSSAPTATPSPDRPTRAPFWPDR